MRIPPSVLLSAALFAAAACATAPSFTTPLDDEHARLEWGMVIHGGAGVTHTSYTPAEKIEVDATITRALQAGHAILARNGSSLDAVEAAIRMLEDHELFNAGRGAVFTNDGKNELDAAIMDGSNYKAGAVAGLHHIKNPISLARMVMDRSKHVMMIGDGAEQFARQHGVEMMDESYFRVERRWQQLQRALQRERDSTSAPDGAASLGPADPSTRFGTVGAVALDRQGRLAAATSTGGMTNKRYGRVGDVPIIGAGTYASPQCAVSATGDGEYFIRWTIAHDVCARMTYQRQSLSAAADTVILGVLERAGGEGGLIALDARGNVAMPFNSEGMTRGYIRPDGRVWLKMFRD